MDLYPERGSLPASCASRYDLPAAIRKLIGVRGESRPPVDVALVACILHMFLSGKTFRELAEEVVDVSAQDGREVAWDGRIH